jgi:cell division septum initiation protein DivIVA
MGCDASPSGATPTLGYDRAAVEAFLGAAAEERSKLEEQIEQSNLRLARARTALGTHRVMVAMLLQAQRECSALRRDAEREAAAIIAAAEREARGQEAGCVEPSALEATADEDPIDLRDPRPGPTVAASAVVIPNSDAVDPLDRDLLTAAGLNQDDEFFEYLRGALQDDEPLGPRSEAWEAR